MGQVASVEVISKVVSTGPCRLRWLLVTNTSASTVYAQVFNKTSLPADTTVPDFPPLQLEAGKSAAFEIPADGWRFDVGLVVASSSTDSTLTASGAAAIFVAAVIE